jgi:hypothetical protein
MSKIEIRNGQLGYKMDKETLDDLNGIFSVKDQKSLFIAGLKQLIADQQEELDTVRLELANMRFDLEATRRERDSWIARVGELERNKEGQQ